MPRSVIPQFERALQKAYNEFWPETPLHPNSQWGKIVNPGHHSRVKNLITNTKGLTFSSFRKEDIEQLGHISGEIILGGDVDEDKRIALTIVKDASSQDSLMTEWVSYASKPKRKPADCVFS